MSGPNRRQPKRLNKVKLHNIFLTLFTAAPILAAACGVCIEDKMAATYDHAVIVTAFKRDHVVVFAEMLNTPSTAQGQAQKVVQAFEAIAGVDHGSVRVSFNPGAISFAINERNTDAQNILISAETALKSSVRFTLIRILRHKYIIN
jgi:hypothetical protein